MAEVTRVVPASTVSLKIQDGAGTPLSKEIANLVGTVTFPISLPREDNEGLAQNAGTRSLYTVVHNGVSGTAEMSYTFYLMDPLNTTAADKAVVDIHRKLWANTLLTSWTSTNPLTDSQRNMLDFVVTVKRAGGASTDQTATYAGYVTNMAPGVEDGKHTIAVTVRIVEDPTWA